MDSIDLSQLERHARRRYELARVGLALLGFAPALLVVLVAVLLSQRPASAMAFGGALFGSGTLFLWYGRSIRRAVLPGFAMGLLPLALALCANRMGHVCTGSACVALCIPACTLGGLGAGLGVSLVGLRRRWGPGFLIAATTLALLTGAMGCSCVGYGGLLGLAFGYGGGLLPALLRRHSAPG